MIEQIRDIEDIPFFLLGIFLKKNGNLESTVVTLIYYYFFSWEKRFFLLCFWGLFIYLFFYRIIGFCFWKEEIYLFI